MKCSCFLTNKRFINIPYGRINESLIHMKKHLLLMVLLTFSAGIPWVNAQTMQNTNKEDFKSRKVFVFIDQLSNQADANTVQDYLLSFNGKIETCEIDLNSQMAVLEVQYMANQDILEVILQKGFTAYIKDELPPAGFKYIYNPDGTWKLKQL